MDRDWRAVFEETYVSPPSPVSERIWRQVFGDEYPNGVDPFSFVTLTELNRFVAELRLRADNVLVDVGCGRGGAGLWVASATGAHLVGIDIAEAALAAARSRAEAMGIAADFRLGSFDATGLEDAVADGVMSVDALLFTPDKRAALHELRRILRPGGRLVLTSWDYHRQPIGRPPQVDDHRPLLATEGFETIAYEDTDDWLNRMRRTSQGLLDASAELAQESGVPEEELRRDLEEMAATTDAMTRRFLVVAVAV